MFLLSKMNSQRLVLAEGVLRSLQADWRDVYAPTHSPWNEDAWGESNDEMIMNGLSFTTNCISKCRGPSQRLLRYTYTNHELGVA